MKLSNKITLVLITVLSLFSYQKTFSQCFQIESVLVNACDTGADEGFNEMVRFQVGPANLDSNKLSVDWPTGLGWLGVIQNATSAAKVIQLNANILAAGGSGKLVEPPGGIIPANSKVILVSGYDMSTTLNSFGALSETIYIIFQDNIVNNGGHFGNSSNGTLKMTFSGTGGCSDTVSYTGSKLLGGAGSSVNFTPTGTATYVNNGCVAPVEIFTVDAGTTPINGCPGSKVSLLGTAVGQQSVAWSASPGGGVFTAPTSLSTDYTIPVGATGTFVLTLTATNAAGTKISDFVNLIVNSVISPTVASVSYCQGSIATPLTATSLSGAALNWYGTSATGGTASATAPTPSTATVVSTTYYVSQTVGSCESARAPIAVTINPAPNLQIMNQSIGCGVTTVDITLPAVTAGSTGGGILSYWIDPSATTALANSNAVGVGTYYIKSTSGTCFDIKPVTVALVGGTIVPPTVAAVAYCQNSVATPLTTLSGATLNWYGTLANGGTASPTAPTPSTATVGSTTYYVSQTVGTCESTRAAIVVSVVADTGAIITIQCDPTQATRANTVFFDWNNPPGFAPKWLYTYSINGGPLVPGTVSSTHLEIDVTPGDSVKLTITSVVGLPCITVAPYTCSLAPPCIKISPEFEPRPSTICYGSSFPALSTTSLNGVTGTWTPDKVDTKLLVDTWYTFKADPKLYPCALTVGFPIHVKQNIDPKFNVPTTVCQNTTPPLLLGTTDVPSIPGTWLPNVVSTANSGTSDYIFTATPGAGVCVNQATLSITVIPNSAPVFDAVPDICAGEKLLPLPTTSKNGIIGTWSPALDNTKTTTYTFTPNVIDTCTPKVFLTITVIPKVTPVFTSVAPICSGTTLLPLPTKSNNAIIGTWSPALDNTKTTTYTFTPTAAMGQCTLTADVVITVNPKVTPTFNAVSPICSGVALSPLPTTSINGITGTWSPALDNTATKTYTFTPTTGLCATTTDLKITVNPIVTPTFSPVAAICSGASLTPLPTTSTNLITGTWSPVLNNTATTTYTFKPTAGLCATATTLEIKVNPKVIPAFTAVPDICSGVALSPLPTTSNNGITGTWSPALDNTATKTYTFTPTTGLCATTADLKITVNPKVTPTFAAVSPICSGVALSPLPTTSINGITGTWSPALDNTKTTKYTFTPTVGVCAIPVDLTITVLPIVTPLFNPVSPICAGTAFTLPLSSTNGITGTWSPVLDNTVSKTYTFIPDVGQCVSATPIKLTITVIPLPVASATPSGQSICSGDTSAIALTSTISGTIFDWTSVQTNVNGASSGTGSKISQTLTTLGNNPGSAVYSIVPNVNGCKGLSILTTVTVNPIPVVTANTTLLPICSGTTTDIALTSNVVGTTFSWTVVPKGVLGALSGNGATIAQTIKTVGLVQGTVDYLITPKANGCVGLPITVTLTVNPTPEVFGSTGTTICSGETTSISLSPNIPGTTFTWTVLPTGVMGAVDGSGDLINQTLEADTVPGKAIYTITPSLNGCDGKSINVAINVNAAPVPAITDGIICVDQASNTTFKSYTLATGLSTANFDFEWFLGGVLVDGAVSSSYEAKIAGTYSVIVTNTLTGCVSKEVAATVVTNYPAENPFSATVTDAFTPNSVITIAVTGGTGPFLYQLDLGAPQSENVFMGASSGFHKVTVTDPQGCTNMSQTVTVIDFPKYFTPNGDGMNDTWNIGSLNDPSASVFIYDRYGKLIKQISASNGQGWDGTYNGKQMPSTDYWFTLNYFESNTNKSFRAHFTLKR